MPVPTLTKCWLNSRQPLLQYLAEIDSTLYPSQDTLILGNTDDTDRSIFFQSNDDNRWEIRDDDTTLSFLAYDDAGVYEYTPLAMTRLTPAIEISGDLIVSNAPDDTLLSIESNSGNFRGVAFRTADENRWFMGVNDTAESGSNAGSNFIIRRYDDDGLVITNDPITIYRSTGGVQFGNTAIGFFGATPGSKPTITGARNVSGATGALNNLLNALQTLGLIVNSTTST